MARWRSTGIRVAMITLLCTALAVVASWAGARLLPDADEVAVGVSIGGRTSRAGERAAPLASERIDELLDRRVRLQHEGKTVLEGSLRELGASVDEAGVRDALLAVGRRGGLFQRLDDAWQARRGHVAVALPLRVPLEPVAERLREFKRRHDRRAVPARWDFVHRAPTPHADGLLIDVHEAVAAIAELARHDGEEAGVPVVREAPRATSERLSHARFDAEVSRYQTRFAFLGGEAGRAQNIERAAEGVHGLVMMPGEVISFNELVGPRSMGNGFAEAGEIYKGEMRMGVGGGTCQVASTLHAAAFLGGLSVVERSNHSRPSGYIGIGLDATVAYPHVDLKLKNSFPFPVAVSAVAEKGVLTLTLMGEDRPAEVSFSAATVGVRPYERKVREASWLPEGRVIKKQKGIRGITIEKTRSIRFHDGRQTTETTTDVYPPTNEVYIVAPGTDQDEALPAMPTDGSEPAEGATETTEHASGDAEHARG